MLQLQLMQPQLPLLQLLLRPLLLLWSLLFLPPPLLLPRSPWGCSPAARK